ncbi:hypothetical protein BJ165DRAFT_1478802 [Panaeolus papilionaceus]|nr:hypothetical protein BJ165DRAFT_1478802 [Panaeolus papilionaceus]
MRVVYGCVHLSPSCPCPFTPSHPLPGSSQLISPSCLIASPLPSYRVSPTLAPTLASRLPHPHVASPLPYPRVASPHRVSPTLTSRLPTSPLPSCCVTPTLAPTVVSCLPYPHVVRAPQTHTSPGGDPKIYISST